MEAHISHAYTSYVLDPQVYGLDGSIWKTVSGTPTVTSNKYRLNAAELITYSQYRFGEVEFNVVVPAAPTAGDNRRFGFSGKGLGNRGIIAFEIVTAGELRARVRDKYGNSLFNEVIPWQAAWTNTATLFRIGWTRNAVTFTVTLTDGTSPWSTTYIAGTNPLTLPMGIDILNGNSDNMDVTSVMVAHSNASSPLGANGGSGASASHVQGNVAAAATDLGNPVKVGGTYNSTLPTYTNGQRGDAQITERGALQVNLISLISGENQTANVIHAERNGSPTYISTATTTVVRSGAGRLYGITVTGGTAGTIVVYDNTAASGTVLASFDSTNALESYTFDVSFATGLTVVTAAATKLTVSSR